MARRLSAVRAIGERKEATVQGVGGAIRGALGTGAAGGCDGAAGTDGATRDSRSIFVMRWARASKRSPIA
jgi:hypothetical protein